MSRSGYSDDCDGWALIRWRGAVSSAIKGRRGQAFLRELLAALDAMPEKELISGELEEDGEFCALGAIGHARGLDMSKLDAYDRESVAAAFGIAEALGAEIMYLNDDTGNGGEYQQVEICGPIRPHYPDYGSHWKTVLAYDTRRENHRRWVWMRQWVASQIKQEAAES